VVQESCRSLTDKGMAADLKTVTAQSQKQELTILLQLHQTAQGWWTQAVERCEGRAKERAQRNLGESQRAAAVLNEQLDNAPECAIAHKDATMLQDMARTALSERRFGEAATLFHKSEDMWDLASDRCTGSQKELAVKRQEQSEIDGFNAEFCAPRFDRAREQTQKLRASAAGMSREEKQDALMVAETLWRDALAQCKGTAAQDSARNNAQALARERGTPWVARNPAAALPALASAPKAATATAPAVPVAPVAAAKVASAAPAAAPAATPASMSTAKASPTAAAPLAASAVAAAASTADKATPSLGATFGSLFASNTTTAPSAAPAAVKVPAQPQPQPEEFASGDMRFKGQFVRDVDTPTYSGTGRLSWGNGDVFEGTLRAGKRHGRGKFVWANGHRYDGDWVDDVPTGRGMIDFVSGNHYEGAVENGVPKGQGSMRYASGDSYTGSFLGGEPHGKGSYAWKKGQKFEGDWKAGKPNGQGILTLANGDRYEGTVVDGVPNQTGTFFWSNGDRYTGEWKAGVKSGQGVFTWASGDRWEGQFEADVHTSSGTLIRKTP
jgi:hypothetical protein